MPEMFQLTVTWLISGGSSFVMENLCHHICFIHQQRMESHSNFTCLVQILVSCFKLVLELGLKWKLSRLMKATIRIIFCIFDLKHFLLPVCSVAGAHFDEYIYEFQEYTPFSSKPNDPVFALPEICRGMTDGDQNGNDVDEHSPASSSGTVRTRHWLSLQMEMLVPSARAPPAHRGLSSATGESKAQLGPCK